MKTVSMATASILLCSFASPFPYTTNERVSANCSQIPGNLDHLLKCSRKDTSKEQNIRLTDNKTNFDKQIVHNIWSNVSHTSDHNSLSTPALRQKRSETNYAAYGRSLCDARREYIRNTSWVRARIPNIVCTRNAIATQNTILECHQIIVDRRVRIRHCFPRHDPACTEIVTVSVGCTVTLPRIIGVSR